jgi:hypothetical protein
MPVWLQLVDPIAVVDLGNAFMSSATDVELFCCNDHRL